MYKTRLKKNQSMKITVFQIYTQKNFFYLCSEKLNFLINQFFVHF